MNDPAREGPVFFRHFPKTAGTSLTTTLANIFGDAQCHRFREVTEGFPVMFAGVLQARGDVLSLVSGHIPLDVVPEGACATEFTILREPIARLLSLRRFLEQQPAEDRARMEFGEHVTVAEMLASRNPEVYSQVRNGMARFFGPRGGFETSPEVAYGEQPPTTAVIEQCAAALGRMTVGTVENMPTALRLLQRRLLVPYELETGVENFTIARDGEPSLDDLRALVEANAIDIALYHRITRGLPQTPPPAAYALADGYDRRTLFDPRPGQSYLPPQIPGRQGFELFERETKLCWIGEAGRARIHLAPSASPLALTITLYGLQPRYPMRDIRLRLDGTSWPAILHEMPDHASFQLAPIPPHAGPIELAITQPYAVPVAAIHPDSPDRRRLGVALLNIACEAAQPP